MAVASWLSLCPAHSSVRSCGGRLTAAATASRRSATLPSSATFTVSSRRKNLTDTGGICGTASSQFPDAVA
eukprot:scaffold33506_cov152-Isochrysis_galbana.AAC.1